MESSLLKFKKMDGITKTHIYFWGDTTLSNWGPAQFEYENHFFYNSEQAFMYAKALYFKDYDIANQILQNDNPSIAKSLGRKVKGFDSQKWERVSYRIMVDINFEKFRQNSSLKEILLSTGNKTIVEGSPFDKIWGVGLHWDDDKILDEANWKGKNLLGKALMDVRTMLRAEEKIKNHQSFKND